jgi:hypothetical protein
MWFATFVLFDSIKFELICTFDKHRNAHFVAKFHKSFKDYKLLCQLDKDKGLNIGNAYDNDKAAAVFVQSIANVSRDTIYQKIKSSK